MPVYFRQVACSQYGKISFSQYPRPNSPMVSSLIAVPRGVVLGTDDQTTTLLGTLVNGLADIDQFLLVLEDKVELVVITGTQVDHHVLVAEEPHDGTRVVELIHLVEIWYLIDIAEVDDAEVLDLFGNFVKHLYTS
jgi:hypothetical protein